MEYRVSQLEKELSRLNARLDKVEYEQPWKLENRLSEQIRKTDERLDGRLSTVDNKAENRSWALVGLLLFCFLVTMCVVVALH